MIKSKLYLICYLEILSGTFHQGYRWNFIIPAITEYNTGETRWVKIAMRSESGILVHKTDPVSSSDGRVGKTNLNRFEKGLPANMLLFLSDTLRDCEASTWHPELVHTPMNCCLQPSTTNFLELWGTALNCSLKSFKNS